MRKKKAIHEAISEILRIEKSSLTPEEIYIKIKERDLYHFRAQDPVHVVQTDLRRHCRDLNFPSAGRTKYFGREEGNRFRLLDKPVRVEPNVYRVKQPGKGGRETIVTVPPDEEGSCVNETEAEHSHTEIQWRLLELGSKLGMSVWAPIADRNRSWSGGKIAEIRGLIPSLPRQFDPGTMRTIGYIDVIWLQNQAIIAAFEVEHTSPVYSGLLRMSDLLTMQPNLDIKWYLVAPDYRSEKFASEIARPTFCGLRKPLFKVCRFLPYNKLIEKLDSARDFVLHLKPEFLDDIAEKYDPAEAFQD